MKITIAICVLLGLLAADSFANLWYDGNAELSSYDVKVSRYGQIREGKRLMVFVTEPLRLATLVKPDIRLHDEDQVRVIKLNDVLDFVTGIYPYHVYTSIFMSVENRDRFKTGDLVKSVFSSTEWCGVVNERIENRGNEFFGKLSSYFESEGDKEYRLKNDGLMFTEDLLWVMIRELKGDILKNGESRDIVVFPSHWNRRKAHAGWESKKGKLEKNDSSIVKTRIGKIEANNLSWSYGEYKIDVKVEKEYPHRILAWSDTAGQKGDLYFSYRAPYWQMNDPKFVKERSKLGLP